MPIRVTFFTEKKVKYEIIDGTIQDYLETYRNFSVSVAEETCLSHDNVRHLRNF